VAETINFVVDQFKIQEPNFSLYEKFSDYGNANEYYRKINETEIPLNIVLNISHRNLLRRCRLELFDFDPNLEEEEEDGFENTSLGELEDILRSLDKEEEEAVAVIETKYFQLHEIYSKYSQLKRPEPDISRAYRSSELVGEQINRSTENINQQETEEVSSSQKVSFMM